MERQKPGATQASNHDIGSKPGRAAAPQAGRQAASSTANLDAANVVLDRMTSAPPDATRATYVLPLFGIPASEHEPETSYSYQEIDCKPFARGAGSSTDINPEDIFQGDLGDCWFLSGCAAVARANPEAISRLIHDNHDGTYEVTLYIRKNVFSVREPHTFHVDSKFPMLTPGHPAYAGNGESVQQAGEHLWPLLLEKAFAEWQGQYEGALAGMTGGSGGKGIATLVPGETIERSTLWNSPTEVLAEITQALAERRPVTAGTGAIVGPDAIRRANELGVIAFHEYSVKKTAPSNRLISLQNPWGRNDLDFISIDDFEQLFDNYTIGPKL